MRRRPIPVLAWVVRGFAAIAVAVALLFLPSPWTLPANPGAPVLVRATILKEPVAGGADAPATVEVRLLEGSQSGDVAQVAIDLGGEVRGEIPYAVGDEVLVAEAQDGDGGVSRAVVDRSRGSALLLIVALFAALVVAVAGATGARALFALFASGVLLVRFGIPALLSGAPPLLVAGCIAVTVGTATVLITEGFSRRSTAIAIGIAGSLVVVALVSSLLDRVLAFTPYGGDADLIYLIPLFGSQVDLRGIGLAAVLIGTLGIVDDVAATQAAAVEELRQASPRASAAALWRSTIAIGRSHIGAVINTLPLAYLASAMPLVVTVLTSPGGLTAHIGTEVIAVEVVRSLIGTAGVLLAMPLTTLAALLVGVGERD